MRETPSAGDQLAEVAQFPDTFVAPRAVHAFSESRKGVKLALHHKVSAQPRFQGNETRTRLEGQDSFHVRVASNALRLVEREMRLGPERSDLRSRMFSRLLGYDNNAEALNSSLCEALATGQMNYTTPNLLTAFRSVTETQVQLAQPSCSGLRRVEP
jgi:Domain of unknown function (DUF6285)